MLAAELVGESGAVVGIDRSEAAILAARARAASFSRGSRRPWRVYGYLILIARKGVNRLPT